jgi:hypothetical protein
LPCEIAFEAAKLFRRDDDHFVAPVHGHVLRSFTVDAPHQFAKARLGVLHEKGVNCVGAGRLVQIANVLGVEPSFFFPSDTTKSEEPEVLGLIRSMRAAKLLRAFAGIKDADVRQSIVALTESLCHQKI